MYLPSSSEICSTSCWTFTWDPNKIQWGMVVLLQIRKSTRWEILLQNSVDCWIADKERLKCEDLCNIAIVNTSIIFICWEMYILSIYDSGTIAVNSSYSFHVYCDEGSCYSAKPCGSPVFLKPFSVYSSYV